jgi:hypothetical protein
MVDRDQELCILLESGLEFDRASAALDLHETANKVLQSIAGFDGTEEETAEFYEETNHPPEEDVAAMLHVVESRDWDQVASVASSTGIGKLVFHSLFAPSPKGRP